MEMKLNLMVLFSVAALSAQTSPNAQSAFDLVVYGGTAGGAITAVSGARMGLKAVLLEPRRHIGGMVSGGLSRTDVGRREVIGGYSLEFYWRAGNAYDMAQYLQEIAWLGGAQGGREYFPQDAGRTPELPCSSINACARRMA